jgi:hypothetical protein
MNGPKAADCEHHFEVRIRGGEPLSVRVCTFCRTPDWADLREQLDILYGGNTAALTRAFGGGRIAHVIAYNLNAHGHAIQRVRYMTDEQLLAVPGIGETSLARIRDAFPSLDVQPNLDALDESATGDEWTGPLVPPAPTDAIKASEKAAGEDHDRWAVLEPRLLDCGFCYEEQGEEVHPHPECPIGSRSTPIAPAVEISNAISSRADELPEKPTVFAGGLDSRLLIGGIFYAVSDAHPVVLDPFGPGTPGGLLTLTLVCDRITVDGKEVGDV